MREQVIQAVEQYIDAVRHNDAPATPIRQDPVSEVCDEQVAPLVDLSDFNRPKCQILDRR